MNDLSHPIITEWM